MLLFVMVSYGLLLLTGYALLVKLAARLMSRTHLAWKHCFTYSLVANLIANAVAFIARLLPFNPFGFTWIAFVTIGTFGSTIAFGGWYFKDRALNFAGEPLGLASAYKLTLLALLMLPLLGIAIYGIHNGLGMVKQPL